MTPEAQSSYEVGYIAAVLSAALPAIIAAKNCKKKPAMFLALAFYATGMSFLTSFYHAGMIGEKPDEIIGAFAAILMVFSGGQLRIEAHMGVSKKELVSTYERWTLALLSFLVLPHYIQTPSLDPDFHHKLTLSIGTAITVIGTVAMMSGIIRLSNSWVAKLAMIVLALWTLTEIVLTITDWFPDKAPPMPPEYVRLFSLWKSLFTVLFVLVAVELTLPKDKRSATDILKAIFT